MKTPVIKKSLQLTRWLPALLLCLLALSAVSFCADTAEDKQAEAEAAEAAQHWLSLVDSGQYATSWDEAAPIFQYSVTKPDWEKMMHKEREPLGKVLSRTQKSALYTTTLPGAPEGKYVVLRFETSYENQKSAIETVTPSQGSDGKWRVGGYFIE